MRKIGFIDYYISEWHANNYPEWIKNANEKLGTDYKVSYVWAELDCSPVDGVTTAQWCEKYSAEACSCIEELCEKSDVVMILSPSNPEKHLDYARKAFPFRRKTYVDKTFAPDLKTAEKIFEIAKNNNTCFFSTSALRYAEELEQAKGAEDLIFTGGGSSLEEYIVHQAEQAVMLMGLGEKTVSCYNQGSQRIIKICMKHKRATMIFDDPLPFTVCAHTPGNKSKYLKLKSDFFKALLCDVVRFYESGNTSFDIKETLAVMALRDAILAASQNPGESFVAKEVI